MSLLHPGHGHLAVHNHLYIKYSTWSHSSPFDGTAERGRFLGNWCWTKGVVKMITLVMLSNDGRVFQACIQYIFRARAINLCCREVMIFFACYIQFKFGLGGGGSWYRFYVRLYSIFPLCAWGPQWNRLFNCVRGFSFMLQKLFLSSGISVCHICHRILCLDIRGHTYQTRSGCSIINT